MSGDITYRSPKLCSDCWAPWSGLGPVCNACKQIKALKDVAKNTNTQNQYSSSSSNGYEGAPSLVFPSIVIFLFFYFCYLTNWFPLKVMWWLLTGLVSVVWWILKVLFYLTFY
jgi:hypothetical protein